MDTATILTSTVVATVVSGLISGLYGLYAKQREYMNEYYSLILKRRIVAYEQLENLIVEIKTAVVDTDNKPYHMLFSNDDDSVRAYNLVLNVTSQALWLSDEAFKKAHELNYVVLGLKPVGGAIEFGKNNYQKIADLRADLERILAADLIGLHDIKRFLKQKRNVQEGYREVRVHS